MGEVCARYRVSQRQVLTKVAKGEFPPPLKWSRKHYLFSARAVKEWEAGEWVRPALKVIRR